MRKRALSESPQGFHTGKSVPGKEFSCVPKDQEARQCMKLVEQVVYSSYHMDYSNLTWGELLVQRVVDGRAEERSKWLLWYTFNGLNTSKFVSLHGTVHLLL